jgi:hypothetical protein
MSKLQKDTCKASIELSCRDMVWIIGNETEGPSRPLALMGTGDIGGIGGIGGAGVGLSGGFSRSFLVGEFCRATRKLPSNEARRACSRRNGTCLPELEVSKIASGGQLMHCRLDSKAAAKDFALLCCHRRISRRYHDFLLALQLRG